MKKKPKNEKMRIMSRSRLSRPSTQLLIQPAIHAVANSIGYSSSFGFNIPSKNICTMSLWKIRSGAHIN